MKEGSRASSILGERTAGLLGCEVPHSSRKRKNDAWAESLMSGHSQRGIRGEAGSSFVWKRVAASLVWGFGGSGCPHSVPQVKAFRDTGAGGGTSLSGVGRAALQSWEGWGKGSGRADAPQWAWKAQRRTKEVCSPALRAPGIRLAWLWTCSDPISSSLFHVSPLWSGDVCPMPVPRLCFRIPLLACFYRFTAGEKFCIRMIHTQISHIPDLDEI